MNKESFLSIARKFSQEEGTCLLHSNTRSFLCLLPKEKIEIKTTLRPWETLKELLKGFTHSPLPQWVGYLSYEMGCFADPSYQTPYYKSPFPLAVFYKPSVVIEYHHPSRKIRLHGKLPSGNSSFSPLSYPFKIIKKGTPKKDYFTQIEKCKQWIREGLIYQLNLSHEFILEGKENPFTIFETLYSINPAPYSAYIKLAEGQSLISSSPERFLSSKQGKIETHPIKGTIQRGKSLEEDKLLKQELLRSEKERAELLMITDLMRNDLSRICFSKTVKTLDLWKIESFTNVHHLLSIIQGKSKPLHPIDKLRYCFPGGSISGCPKLKALEKIAEIEKRSRGVYTGSIGYFSSQGDFDFNIAIRTIQQNKDLWNIQLGGGIVFDSDPEKEYQETLQKGDSMFKALGVSCS